MQKVYLHLHNSADKDKKKEIKTTPVPVQDPKRAIQIREADKKRFEKLDKIGKALLIGFMLIYGCYHQAITAAFLGTGSEYSQPAHTQLVHHDQGLGATLLPVPVFEVPVRQTQTRQKDEAIRISTTRLESAAVTSTIPVDKPGKFIICESRSGRSDESPLTGVLEYVLDHWNTPENTNLIDVDQLGLKWNNELDVIAQIKQKDESLPLTIVTLELQEFYESSGKELYTLHPENKAKVKLILRGMDATTQRLLFEETIEKDIVQNQWANYQSNTDTTSQFLKPIYPYSLAMKQALVQTSNEIITLLYKYFPQ